MDGMSERDTRDRDVVEQWKRVDSEFHEPDTYGDSHTLYQLHIVGHRMADEITALRAERDRLREALEWDRLLFARFAKGEAGPAEAQHAWLRTGAALKGEEADRGPGEVTHG